MSRLQDFISKLGLVIIKYTEKQTSQAYNEEEILASPHSELIEELTNLIQKTAKETRHTFLNYIMYVINTINPLVEKQLPLTEDQELFIKEILNNFLESLFELVDISNSTEVQLKYNNIETIAPRFISKGWTGGRVLSEMGELVTKYLLNSITAKREREIALYVDNKLIQEHQSIVFKPILEAKIKELQEVIKQQEELIEQLQHQLETQKNSSQLQKTTELLANLEKQHSEASLTNSGLQKVLIQLQKQHEIQGNELQELKIQLSAAQAQYHDAEQSIDKLKQENEYFQQQLKINQTELRETKEQLMFSQDQYSKLEQIIAKLQKDNSQLQHQLESKQTELQETKQQLIISQESNLKSEQAVATLQEENRQLKATRATASPILVPNILLGRSSFHTFFPNNRMFERNNDVGSQNNDPNVGSSSLNPGGSGTIE